MQAIQAIEAMQAVDDPPLLADAVAIHTRWQENQATFVDDPLGSVTRAASLADEVVSVVTAAAQERVHDLRTAWEGGSAETEQLRKTLRHYRVFIDRLSNV